LVAALAVIEGHLKPEQAWELCRLDEIWQEEQWGIDEEAAAHAALKKSDFLAAYDFFTRCG
jgi:chaperone required for assembly of F1-ATPase